MTTLVALRPEPMPRLHLLHRMLQADVIVIMDDAPFDRTASDGGQHRIWIGPPPLWKETHGDSWVGPARITIPVPRGSSKRLIAETTASPDTIDQVKDRIADTYGDHPGWRSVARDLSFLTPTPSLTELFLPALLKIPEECPKVCWASALDTGDATKADLVLRYCQILGADRLVCGNATASHLDHQAFDGHGVAITVQNWTPKPYGQTWGKWLANLSYLDAVAHEVPITTAIR